MDRHGADKVTETDGSDKLIKDTVCSRSTWTTCRRGGPGPSLAKLVTLATSARRGRRLEPDGWCEYYYGEGWIGLYQLITKESYELLLAFGSLDVSSYNYTLCITSMQILRTHHHGSQRPGKFRGTSMSNSRTCPFLPRSSNWDTAITFSPIVRLQVSTDASRNTFRARRRLFFFFH